MFTRQIAAHPLASALGFALIVVGYFGEGLLSLPKVVLDGLILAGSLGLAYIGSGRL